MQTVPRATIQETSGVTCLIDAGGEILYVSPTIEGVLGFTPGQILGCQVLTLLHPDDRRASRKDVRMILAKPSIPHKIAVRIRHNNGDWRRCVAEVLNLLDAPRIAAMVVNCTQIGRPQRKSGNGPSRMRNVAPAEEPLNAIVHDLKEPLRTISTLTGMVQEKVKLDPEGDLLIGQVLQAVQRMSSFLDGMSSFAASGFQAPRRPMELDRVLSVALADLRHALCASDVHVTWDPLPLAYGDERQIGRVFQNLIANAIKYRTAAPLRIHVSAEASKTGYVVTVKDNGMGIDPRYHEYIFGMLKRLHGHDLSGSGIGLATCRRIMESTGERIWVEESSLGKGSTFCFTVAARSTPCLVPPRGKNAGPRRAGFGVRSAMPSAEQAAFAKQG